MQTQESVRIRLIAYLKNSGIKQGFIATKVFIPQAILSQFKSGKREIYQEQIELLDKFLTKQNY